NSRHPGRVPATGHGASPTRKFSLTTAGGLAVESSFKEFLDRGAGRSTAPKFVDGQLKKSSGRRVPAWLTSKSWSRSFVLTSLPMAGQTPTRPATRNYRCLLTLIRRPRMRYAGQVAL